MRRFNGLFVHKACGLQTPLPSSPHFCASYFGCVSIISLFVIVLITLFYIRLSLLIAIVMAVIILIMEHFIYLTNISFGKQSWIVYLSVFVITWIFQLIGHKIEGQKPSFLKDLQFLLIGPIWLLGFILKKTGIRY